MIERTFGQVHLDAEVALVAQWVDGTPADWVILDLDADIDAQIAAFLPTARAAHEAGAAWARSLREPRRKAASPSRAADQHAISASGPAGSDHVGFGEAARDERKPIDDAQLSSRRDEHLGRIAGAARDADWNGKDGATDLYLLRWLTQTRAKPTAKGITLFLNERATALRTGLPRSTVHLSLHRLQARGYLWPSTLGIDGPSSWLLRAPRRWHGEPAPALAPAHVIWCRKGLGPVALRVYEASATTIKGMARELGIDRNTVKAALQDLAQHGLRGVEAAPEQLDDLAEQLGVQAAIAVDRQRYAREREAFRADKLDAKTGEVTRPALTVPRARRLRNHASKKRRPAA